jgi:hypothetical protein
MERWGFELLLLRVFVLTLAVVANVAPLILLTLGVAKKRVYQASMLLAVTVFVAALGQGSPFWLPGWLVGLIFGLEVIGSSFTVITVWAKRASHPEHEDPV